MSNKQKPLKRPQMQISISKDLISFVRKMTKSTKAPSVNRWVNNVLRDLWKESEK